MIRQKTGLERIRILLTNLREYRCRDCDTKFRAPDRRAIPRDHKIGAGIIPKQVL